LTHDPVYLSAALALKIASVVPLSQHPRQVATGTVYPTTPLHCWAFHETFRPPQNVAVFVDAEEFRCVKCSPTEGKLANIGNRIVFSGNEWTSGEALVENVKLPLRLHCESVDRVLQLDRPL